MSDHEYIHATSRTESSVGLEESTLVIEPLPDSVSPNYVAYADAHADPDETEEATSVPWVVADHPSRCPDPNDIENIETYAWQCTHFIEDITLEDYVRKRNFEVPDQ